MQLQSIIKWKSFLGDWTLADWNIGKKVGGPVGAEIGTECKDYVYPMKMLPNECSQ